MTHDRPTIAQVREIIALLDKAYEQMTRDPDHDGMVHDLMLECSSYALALRWVAGAYGRDGIPRGIVECTDFRPDLVD